MLHELVHSLGFVSSCSPNALPGAHVGDDPRDLMYGLGDWAIPDILLDVGNDDCYDHSNPSCPDLADHAILTMGP